MKNTYKLLLLPLAAMLWSCNDNVIDNLTSIYDENMQRYNFSTAKTGETEKLKKGLKQLNIEFDNNNGATFSLGVVSREWTLQPGVYKPAQSAAGEAAANEFYGYVTNGTETYGAITEGDLEVNMVGTDYDISGIFTGNDGRRYVLNYRGPIEFVIGIDDPEPSGYTVTMKAEPVVIMDYTTWQQTVIPGVNKYTLAISDPNGNDAAFFEAINKDNMTMQELVGTYTIAGSPMEPWLIDNGWLVPEYGMAGGAFVVSSSGEKQYITQGKINIESVEGINGETLYSFCGENLSFITTSGNGGSFSFSIRFSSFLEKSGTELKDLSFQSAVLGCEVKYSVVLPESFDGTKTFPVLYMLHGASGGNNDWLDSGNIASHTGSVETEMIIVSPQASFESFDSFYIDGFRDGGMNYETFFVTEFMPAIEAMYKGNGKRGVSGLSMGGFGALYYGLKYADMFSGIYACSPGIGIEGTPNIFDMIWTPGASDIAVEIGTEDFLYEVNKAFYETMQYSPLLSGFTYIERAGAHDWPFWSACSPKIIKFFDERF
ncbi:MAG: esterase family protein [Muribaculaceae bacterium]|nr:esterase family protein [Muribaculaceae bacterium]